MSELDELQSKLKVAEQKAKDAESMMFQAAQYGKDLLEKNMSLEAQAKLLMDTVFDMLRHKASSQGGLLLICDDTQW